ncbi:hypothetical protein HPB50_007685 [Hyalomma asiaticum]|uniref:Uncharacterized protein n=1 Tax=Hyalomma asiaticum TaxID=266040 RepID=A0ACB7TCL1_HYAAI|nr:hypothetical protein HPB50_007685 [Hyalomma asiaticum]
MEPHRLASERVKDKPQVPDWSDTPYSAPGESKRRDWHTHHPPPVTQQQLDSAGPSKKNFVPLRRGGVAKDDGKDDVKEGKGDEGSRADDDKAKEAAKKDDVEKRMPVSRSRGGSGGRFEANRGRGGRGGNGYSSGNVGYRGRSREYRRTRTERGPRFDRKKDDGSEESSGVEEEKPANRLRPKDEESEGSEEACPDAERKNRTAKETSRAREPRRDESKNKEEKSAFSPRGEPSRRGRGGAVSLGRSSRGRYQAGGYGPPTLKAPFGKPEDGNKEEEVSKEATQGNKPRSNSSRPVVRRPNRMEPLPPRFQKNQPRRQDNLERNKGRGGRGAGPSKDALSDVANEDWETASESSDVADRRGFDDGVRQQSAGSKKGPPAASKAPGGGQERRRSGGEVRRGGGGAPGERNGRGPVQRRDSGGGGPPARMGRGSGSRTGGRSRQQQQRPGDVGAKGEPSQATLVYRVDEMKLQDPVGVQAAIHDVGARKHIKKSEQGQPNGKLEKEKPNALEGIDLSNYASVVVIDDHPAVTDPSLCDVDDGDFQEVTSKKRHKVLADGDPKKKKETRSKTNTHSRQNKLPPRLIRKRESDRLFSSKTECQLPTKTEGSATDSADATTGKTQQHCTFSSKELAPPAGVLRPVVNAWEKPITHALRGSSPPSAAPQSMSAPAVSSGDVLVSSKSSSFDRSSDNHDSGIDVSDQPASAASSQRSSPSNDGKAPLLGASPKSLAAMPVGVPPSAGAVGVDSGKPMGTVIFENKNFKAENAALDKFESQTKSQEPSSSNAPPMLAPVAPKAPNDTVEPNKCSKGEDTVDMKLDFTFDPELTQFGDEKQAKHIAITRSLSSEITSANSPISPSTDDLNLKIASVKKVWENVGPLPTVLEHGAVSVAGDDTGSAAVQAPSFGSFGGSASSDTSFATNSTATESMAQQGQTEASQATSEAAFG